MFKVLDALRLLVITISFASGVANAAEPASASEKDALRATLLESKEKSKGVSIHSAGATIAMVVISLDERYVIGRNQQATRVVIRLDRIDGVSAAF